MRIRSTPDYMNLVPRSLRTFVAVVLVAVCGASATHAQTDFTPRAAVEFTARDGLPNFFGKLKKGEPVVVAYLGGSITGQNGWRVQSRDWLRKTFPEAKVREIHAAIGGTGSELGVFRVESDALSYKPDLLFVEFAVNDSWAQPERVRKAMEGIVRKTWAALPEAEVCFVYTITDKDTAGLVAGKMKRSESVMEEVADHYGIPSIHFGVEVARLEKEGKLVMKSAGELVTRVSGDELDEAAQLATDAQGRIIFSKDGVHPYPETGHVLYTQALIRSFEKMRDLGAPRKRELGTPLTPDHWQAAKQVPLDQGGVFSGEVTRLDPKKDAIVKVFANRVETAWRFEPGASLRFKFKGTKVGFYDLLGPEGAVLEINVDGKVRKQTRFDGYCTYRRLANFAVADNLPDAVHEVTITVTNEQIDKRKLLFESARADYDKTPEKYAPSAWFAGTIFVVGEIVRE